MIVVGVVMVVGRLVSIICEYRVSIYFMVAQQGEWRVIMKR